ncbi:hypothetical protein VFC49_02570 [Thermococcus sp. SY098]|uniref:hypothetical protein n=1 Tax=Thermococcus sp. SY098 TaxID=3111325 RepID=UPI002D777890|nr:hypothetical protein [Thermococcus sp. SY098]WRS53048.1 hypothetical protein VFC49_02570 [Thermococcus sp. SY098]
MVLKIFQAESANIEECLNHIKTASKEEFLKTPGKIEKSKISLNFGAFMNVTIALDIDESQPAEKGLITAYASARNKRDALKKLQDALNKQIKSPMEIVDFEIGTYTTPVTRRTYAVGIIVYNIPLHEVELSKLSIKERRKILAKALELFNYNPKVLNISEVARTFGVSRDSIYYDIEQILKERRLRSG